MAGGSYSGTLVDGLSGAPRSGEGLRAIAKASDTSDLTCSAKAGDVDANGAFTIADLCGPDTYVLSLTDENLLIEEPPTIAGSDKIAGASLKVWRAPSGDGIYLMSKDDLTMVRTFTDVKYETKVDDPTMKVAYPYMKPTGKVKTVLPGDFFVISGKSNTDRLKRRPIIADPGKRTFADGAITDHVWVGVKFNSDTDWQPVEAQLDASKVKEVKSGDRIVQYMPSDALPEGRYALYGDDDKRMFIVDFGKSFAPDQANDSSADGG